MSRILLIEDEVGIRMTIEDRLKAEGYEVEVAEDGVNGYERACAGGIDLVVLDLMLPKKPGLDICRDLRGAGIVTPVLMLTAKGQVMDRVKGLRTGADDYLVKPFQMLELVARIEALLRRDRIKGGASEAKLYAFGDVRRRFQASGGVSWRREVAALGEGVPIAAVFRAASATGAFPGPLAAGSLEVSGRGFDQDRRRACRMAEAEDRR